MRALYDPAVAGLTLGQLTRERDRARALAGHLEQICAERERLLWMAIESHASHSEEARVGRLIAAHLRETHSQPPTVTP